MWQVVAVKILQTSLSAALIILIVLTIRLLTINRLPKKTFVILWNIVLCRLLIPFNIPLSLNKYSIFNGGEYGLPQVKHTVQIVPNTFIHYIADPKPPAGAATGGVPEISSNPIDVMSFLPDRPFVTIIWLSVAIIIALFFLITHLRCLREYKAALPIADYYQFQGLTAYPARKTVQIKQLDTISVPLTYGIRKPVILIPKIINCTEEWRLKYIIFHELIHIKHYDVLKKLLLAAALCIHWFNPMVWVMYILANRDIELACDEAVVRAFGQTSRTPYALALINMEKVKAGLLPLCSGFNKKGAEKRIISIMKAKEPALLTRVLSLALVFIMMFASAASHVEAKTEPKEKELFRIAMGDDVDKYTGSINRVDEESGKVITRDYSIRIETTIFTDHNVYAIVAVEGDLPEEFNMSGRIVDPKDTPNIPRWEYMLFGSMEEIGLKDGIRYFFCSAVITHVTVTPEDIDEEFIKAHTSPDSDWLENDSLKDCEGKVLEFTLEINGNKHVLSTAIARVFTGSPDNYPEKHFLFSDQIS